MFVSPWERLNLRCNPFGEPPRRDLPGLIVAPLDEMAAWLKAPRRAVQFIGECGRGKSSHLARLGQLLGRVPYVHLVEGQPIPELPEGPRLLLDEAQRLPPRRRQQLFARIETLVLGTHVDLARELAQAGLEARSVWVGGADDERVAAIVERRLEWARLGPGPVPRLSASGPERLIERFSDDLRAMLAHLYEVYQDLDAVVEVEP